jgi:hypothetical protein
VTRRQNGGKTALETLGKSGGSQRNASSVQSGILAKARRGSVTANIRVHCVSPDSTWHANIARLQEISENLRRFHRFSENPAFKNENDVLLQ